MQQLHSAAFLPHLAPLCLRLALGWGFMAHGAAKISRGTAGFEKLLTQTGIPLAHINAQVVPWLELIGGITLVVGLFVRIVSIPLLVTMIIAMISIHARYGFSTVNTIGLSPKGPVFGPPGYEINVLYIAGLISLLITGAGRFSMANLRLRRPAALVGVPLLLVLILFGSHRTFAYQPADTTIVINGVPLEPQDISPLLIGEKIPALSLKTDQDSTLYLEDIIKRPTVVVFYRGGWCPYCVKQLIQLQRIEPELRAAGYQLMAVSTDSPDNLRKTRQKEKLSFILLSDADLSLAKAMGIAYKAPLAYDKFLPAASGGRNVDKLLPVPSVFIVDQKGTIQYEYINPDFKQRLSPVLLGRIATIMVPEQSMPLQ